MSIIMSKTRSSAEVWLMGKGTEELSGSHLPTNADAFRLLLFFYAHGTRHRTGHISAYMLDVLHWLPLQQRIMFRIGAMVWRCILGLAPAYRYLRDLCHPTPGTRGCSSLRSSEQGLLFVPFARTSTTQARAFSVVGPSVWNGLPLS